MLQLIVVLLLISTTAIDSSAQYNDAPYGAEIREFIAQGDYVKAQQLIDSTVAIYGDGLSFELLRVELAYSQLDTITAFLRLDKLIQQHPQNPSVLYHYGKCYQVACKYGQADSMYVLALASNKSKSFATYLKRARARSFFLCYNYDEAIKVLYNLLQENPKDLNANILLGAIYIRLNNLDQAFRYTRKASKISKNEITENNIAAIYMRQGKYQRAIKILEPLLKKYPDFDIGLGNLGYSYTQTGKVEQGLEMLLQAAKTEAPPDGYFYRCLAIVYLQKNDIAKACECLTQAIENDFTPSYGNEVLELQQKHCK